MKRKASYPFAFLSFFRNFATGKTIVLCMTYHFHLYSLFYSHFHFYF